MVWFCSPDLILKQKKEKNDSNTGLVQLAILGKVRHYMAC